MLSSTTRGLRGQGLHTANLAFLDKLWWKGEPIFVPNNKDLRHTIMQEFHDAQYAGHLGYTKTLHHIQQNFTWPGMASEIHEYIHGCVLCQWNKIVSVKSAGFLQPIEVPPERWHTVTTDFVTGLPVSQDGFEAILVSVDKLTKYVHLGACHSSKLWQPDYRSLGILQQHTSHLQMSKLKGSTGWLSKCCVIMCHHQWLTGTFAWAWHNLLSTTPGMSLYRKHLSSSTMADTQGQS